MNNLEFAIKLEQFKRAAWNVYPDLWNEFCLARGMKLGQAQRLYYIFQNMAKGTNFFLNDDRDTDIEEVELTMAILDDILASKDYIHGRFDAHGIRFENRKTYFALFWRARKEDSTFDEEIRREEMNFKDVAAYVHIADLAKAGHKILAICEQVCSIDNIRDYDGPDKPEEGHYLKVFDGDVFCVYNQRYSDYFNSPEDNGLYVADGGAFRKLLYTKGKGYLRHGEPDYDEDTELDFEEGFFSDYKITGHHTWRRIGNVNIDISFLKEPKDKQ